MAFLRIKCDDERSDGERRAGQPVLAAAKEVEP